MCDKRKKSTFFENFTLTHATASEKNPCNETRLSPATPETCTLKLIVHPQEIGVRSLVTTALIVHSAEEQICIKSDSVTRLI